MLQFSVPFSHTNKGYFLYVGKNDKMYYNCSMNINYDKEFGQLKDQIDASNPPKLLLHVCCAPCATYCLTRILDKFDVTLYYANDNITARDEWDKRLHEIRKLVDVVNDGKYEVTPLRSLKLVVQDFDSSKFFAKAKGLEQEREGGARCKECFVLRLTDTRNYALTHNFDLFGTTLTVSPYKNSQLLNEIGINLQMDNLKWLPSDFKKQNGYNQSVQLSLKYDLYRQHYCGCCFSLAEQQNAQKQ